MDSNLKVKDGIKRWLTNEHLRAVAILVIILMIFYKDVVFESRTFLMETAVQGTMSSDGPYNDQDTTTGFLVNDAGAIAWQIEPYNWFISKSIKLGDFPLWNPYAGLAGSPLLADGTTGPLEPIQFFFFLFPNRFWPYTLDLQLLIRFFLAGFGCYLFAKRLGLNFWASIASGVLFMLSSYFVTYGDHPQIRAESLLPLVLYGYDRLADLEDKRGIWICSLLIGWSIVAAMPEATFFGLLLGSLWYFNKSILQKFKGEAVSLKVTRSLIRYLISTAIGFLISAVYLLPFIEYVLISKSVHAAGLVNNPLVLSNAPLPASLLPGLIFQAQDYYFLQIGFIVLFSSVYVLIGLLGSSKHRNSVIFFSLYALIFLLSIYNFPPTNWIRGLPVFNQIVIHKYSIPSIVFSLAILAGILIDEVKDNPLSYKRISLSIAIVILFFIGLPSLGGTSTSPSIYFGDNKSIYAAFGLIICVLSIPVYILAFLHKHRKISLQGLQFGLLILVSFEPFLWGSRINRRDRIDPYQAPPFVEYLRNNKDSFRIFALDGILYPNISTAYQLFDIRWLGALFPRRAYDFSKQFLSSNKSETMWFTGTQFPISDRMFDLLNVKYILAQNTIEDNPMTTSSDSTQPAGLEGSGSGIRHSYTLVYQDQYAKIYQNMNVLPRAYIAYHIIDVSNFNSALDSLSDPKVVVGQTAIVENSPIDFLNSINQDSQNLQITPGNMRLVSSDEVDVQTETEAPGLLVLAEQYYPGWEAFVDGKPVPIYPVDGIFRGVFLNPGSHLVRFIYQPRSFIIGSVLSLIALVMILYFIIHPLPFSR